MYHGLKMATFAQFTLMDYFPEQYSLLFDLHNDFKIRTFKKSRDFLGQSASAVLENSRGQAALGLCSYLGEGSSIPLSVDAVLPAPYLPLPHARPPVWLPTLRSRWLNGPTPAWAPLLEVCHGQPFSWQLITHVCNLGFITCSISRPLQSPRKTGWEGTI